MRRTVTAIRRRDLLGYGIWIYNLLNFISKSLISTSQALWIKQCTLSRPCYFIAEWIYMLIDTIRDQGFMSTIHQYTFLIHIIIKILFQVKSLFSLVLRKIHVEWWWIDSVLLIIHFLADYPGFAPDSIFWYWRFFQSLSVRSFQSVWWSIQLVLVIQERRLHVIYLLILICLLIIKG